MKKYIVKNGKLLGTIECEAEEKTILIGSNFCNNMNMNTYGNDNFTCAINERCYKLSTAKKYEELEKRTGFDNPITKKDHLGNLVHAWVN